MALVDSKPKEQKGRGQKRFRKRGEVEAVHLGSDLHLGTFLRSDEEAISLNEGLEIRRPAPESNLFAWPGDWLIRHAGGSLTCCPSVVFEAEYEEVPDA